MCVSVNERSKYIAIGVSMIVCVWVFWGVKLGKFNLVMVCYGDVPSH